jgi:two-component system, NarL family, sensor kinase
LVIQPADQPDTDSDILRKRNRELSILNSIADALNRSVNLNQTLTAALGQVADLLDLRTGWIWLLDEENGESYLAAFINLPPGLISNPHLMEGSCYCLDTYRAGDLDGAANVNVVTCSRLRNLVDGTDGLRYHASIPLYAHGKQLGVLNVASPDWRLLNSDDLRLLYTVGDLLSIAIERGRLYSRSVELGAIEERNRLAREIHDTLAQGLTAIALQLETADALLGSSGNFEPVKQAIKQALSLVRTNLNEARRSVHDLRVAPLENRDLTQALADLATEFVSNHGLKVDFKSTGDAHPLTTNIEIGIFRIAQEALTNVAQHALADRVQIELTKTSESVTLSIVDNGRGFESHRIPPGRFGLIGMNERARLLGGSLKIKSSIGEGTRLDVSVPLKAQVEG